jgi:hypothetical protein
MVADELRRQADEFVDLATLQMKVGRDPGERAVRAQGNPYYGQGQRPTGPGAATGPGFGGQVPGFLAGSAPVGSGPDDANS